jgi:hypothetical protein
MFDFGSPLKDDITFDLSFHTFHGTGETTRLVEITTGRNDSLATWNLAPGDSFQRLEVPAAAASQSLLLIKFRFLNPQSPHSLGLSADPRELTIKLVGVRIAAASGKER